MVKELDSSLEVSCSDSSAVAFTFRPFKKDIEPIHPPPWLGVKLYPYLFFCKDGIGIK